MILSKYIDSGWRMGCVLALLLLHACAIANPKGAQYVTDQTVTGALAPTGEKLDDKQLGQDSKIIRDHVIKASLSEFDSQKGMDWQNEATGSRGLISNIQPIREGGRQCRTFKTTREAFDGVLVYQGKACDTPEGGWVLSQFTAQ